MSGGSLNYFYSSLEDHAGDFDDMELDDLVKDLSNLFYAREWYLSGDTSIGDWREARDAFKKKWFAQDARAERINKYFDELRFKVLDSFGLSDKYCKNCDHWTPGDENDPDEYGWCDLHKGGMEHRGYSCSSFKPRHQQ